MKKLSMTRQRIREILENYASRQIDLWEAEMALIDLIDEITEESLSDSLLRSAYREVGK